MPDDPQYEDTTAAETEPRTRPGCVLLVVPILFVGAIVLAYTYVFALGVRGRPADGERVTMTFTGCAEARPLVVERVAAMGLGDPAWADAPGGWTLTATLPADPDVAAAIPATLTAAGRFEVRADGDGADAAPIVAAEQVESASVGFGPIGSVTSIQLDEAGATALREHMMAHPEGRIALWFDGGRVQDEANLPAEPRGALNLRPPREGARAELEVAVERALLLNHGPLPCEVAVRR
jgi:hypothetical protein